MKILIIGSANIDITVKVDRFPTKGETIMGKELAYAFGGKGANQAITIGKLGGDAIFLACVGDDAKGHELVENLKANHVDVSHIKYSKQNPTGTAIINVDEKGDNNIAVIQGANLECDKAYILEKEELFKECDYVLLQLEIPFDAVEEAIRLAAKYNKKVILNPAPASAELNKDIYKYITYMTPNETESAIMAGLNTCDVMKAARVLKDLGVQNILITLGEDGSLLYKDENNIIQVPARKVKAVDTVAAGDCYNGAFVKALAEGMSEEDAMKYASKASAIAVTRCGAQESIPTEEEVKNFGE